MSKIVSFVNQKGGVGKSTFTRELAFYFAGCCKKVLAGDSDQQANLTKGTISDEAKGLYNALSGYEYEIKQINKYLSILTGSTKLAKLEKDLVAEMDAYIRMKELFKGEAFKEYDYIFIDCPPSLGILTINALVASTHVVIPINLKLYSLQGTNELFETLNKVKKNFNPGLKVAGIIINNYDTRPLINREIKNEVLEIFGDQVFPASLSQSIKIEEAIALKKGIVEIPKYFNSKTCEEIISIGNELFERLGE